VARLDGVSVLVVDATARLGHAASAAFAAEGARVMVAGADPGQAENLAHHIGHGARSVGLDPLDPASCEQAVEAACRAFGSLDVLCNRAPAPAPPPARKLLHELSPADWRAALDEGLTAVVLPTRYALRRMLDQRAGTILVVGSGAGLVGVPGLSGFSAGSAGLLNFTRNIALDAKRSGSAVRANMMCLGSAWDALLPSDSDSPPAASELAPTLVFLASAESQHLNGAVVAVDDGLTAWR
jgi:NAD(P)-dependent dehydrogenase (short-subunit alcohol dehydrogenase family)